MFGMLQESSSLERAANVYNTTRKCCLIDSKTNIKSIALPLNIHLFILCGLFHYVTFFFSKPTHIRGSSNIYI